MKKCFIAIKFVTGSAKRGLISLVPRPLSFLCWGRERKGLVDLRVWFCVTANAQNLGVILIYRVHGYCTDASIRGKLK